jgi:hypothetical protein
MDRLAGKEVPERILLCCIGGVSWWMDLWVVEEVVVLRNEVMIGVLSGEVVTEILREEAATTGILREEAATGILRDRGDC